MAGIGESARGRRARKLGIVAAALVIAGAAASAGARPRPGNTAPSNPADLSPAPAGARDDDIRVEGSLGALDPEAVEGPLDRARGAIDACYRAGLGRFRYLAGRLAVRARVRPDGSVRTVAFTAPIGDRDTERCVGDVVRGLRFPSPRGGEAEFEYGWEFRTTAPIQSWTQRDVQAVFVKRRGELRACEGLGNVPPGLRVTIYVMPGGKVGALGLGAEAQLDERYAACVAGRVQTWTFADPQGRVARATYQFGR